MSSPLRSGMTCLRPFSRGSGGSGSPARCNSIARQASISTSTAAAGEQTGERGRCCRGPGQHSPIDAPEEAPPPPANGRLAAAWLGSLALLGAGGAALVVFQAEIAAAWPPAARFYAALGLG